MPGEKHSYSEYVANFRDRFNIKKYNSYHQVDQHKYERIESLKESYKRDGKNYSPKKDYDNYQRALNKNNQLGRDIEKRIEELKNAEVNKLRNNDDYKIAADLHHKRSIARRAMKAKYQPLEKNISDLIKGKGLGGSLSTNDVVNDLRLLYDEYIKNPSVDLSTLETGKKLMYSSLVELNNEFYQELIAKFFEDYKEYRALRETYKEKDEEYYEHRQVYEQTEKKIKNIKETYSLSNYKNETITTESLSGAGVDNNTMTLDEAVKYCERQKTKLHDAWLTKYDDVETYLNMQKEMDAKQNDNKDAIFEELASAKAEARKYNGFMQFLGRYLLPGSVFKLGAVMNKVDALTDILTEGGYTQEEIDAEVTNASVRVADQLLEDADHLTENTMEQNNNLLHTENSAKPEATVEEIKNKEKLPPEETKQLGDNTNLEKGNVQKSPIVDNNKQFELDNNKEIQALSNQEMGRPNAN